MFVVSSCWAADDDSIRHHEQRWSDVMKKLIGIVLVAMSMATPALAQYYETGNRSGYWAPGRVVTTAPARVHSRARYLGEQSYAMSPRGNIYGGYFNYGDTGGGSPGYNQLLMTW
jgi:hypothetical protein